MLFHVNKRTWTINIKGTYFYVYKCVPVSVEPLFLDPVQVSDPSTVVANGGTAGNYMLKLITTYCKENE